MKLDEHWTIRRRIIIATLLFCAGEIVYLTGWAESTSLAETIANGVLILAASVIGSYVFGAVWDDFNMMSSGRRRRRDVAVEPPEGEE